MVNGFQPLLTFTKSSILGVWQGPEHASDVQGRFQKFVDQEFWKCK